MTEWGVVTVLAALAAFGAVLIRPMLQLNGSITRLTTMLDGLSRELNELASKNAESHGRLWQHNGEQDHQINEQERRLSLLEARRKEQLQ